jgi:predicted TIM-barrel enzyme
MDLKLVPSDEDGRKVLEEAKKATSAFREAGINARIVQPVYQKPYVNVFLLKISQKAIEQGVHRALEEQGISYNYKTEHLGEWFDQ